MSLSLLPLYFLSYSFSVPLSQSVSLTLSFIFSLSPSEPQPPLSSLCFHSLFLKNKLHPWHLEADLEIWLRDLCSCYKQGALQATASTETPFRSTERPPHLNSGHDFFMETEHKRFGIPHIHFSHTVN